MQKKQDKISGASGVPVQLVKKQPNALLTFIGEQDLEFFGVVCKSVSEFSQDETGGSRELSVRAEGDRIVIGYKKEMNI